MLTVIGSVIGLMGIVGDLVRESTASWSEGSAGVPPVLTVAAVSALLYFLFWSGNQNVFLRVMAGLVAVMSVCFLATAALLMPAPAEFLNGLVPRIPDAPDALLILAGMVGTTMATVCLVTRSYLVAENGWKAADFRSELRDSAVALSLTFLVSAAIMVAAAGTLHAEGLTVDSPIDMVRTLAPLAGALATGMFVVGITAAGISSTFPNYLLGPWAVFDLQGKPRQMRLPQVRLAVAGIALLGFVVPFFGGRPAILMIASQAISPVVMPLLIVLVTLLLTRGPQPEGYRNPRWLTVGLWITLAFSLAASAAAFVGLAGFLKSAF